MKFISEHSIKTNVVIVSAYSDLKLAVEAKELRRGPDYILSH